MLAARLLPCSDGWQTPYVCHLLVAVDLLHEFIVELMWHFLALPRPNDELGGVSKETARDVCRGIGFLPCDDIQNLVAQFGQTVCHGEDIVVCAAYPYCTIVLELLTAETEPRPVPLHHVFLRLGLVPFSLVHAHYLAALHGDSSA